MACPLRIIPFSTCRGLPWPRGDASFCASRRWTRDSIWPRRGDSLKSSSLLAFMKPNYKQGESFSGATRALCVCVALYAVVLAGCRQDMHLQPKYVPEDPSAFFPDG